VADGERVPVRLVQENGNTISLDATSIDMVVERQQSAFGIPLADAKKMAIDLNQAMVGFEIQGVFTDDKGQEVSSQAKAVVDLNHTQTLFSEEAAIAYVHSLMNKGKPGKEKESIGHKGARPQPTSVYLPSKRKSSSWLKWHKKYLSFPVAYWVEQNATATGGLPVTSGLNVRFSASDLSATNMVGGALTHGAIVNTWVDSASSVVANKSGSPIYKEHGAGGNPYVYFDGSSRFEVAYNAALHPAEKTIFIVANSTNAAADTEQYVINTRESSNKGWTIRYRFGSNNKIRLALYNSGSDEVSDSTTTLVASVPQLHAHTVDQQGDGTYHTKFYNRGVLEDTDTSDDYDVVDDDTTQIGSGTTQDYLTGNIYEIIVYNRILTDDEREQVEGYLSTKYSVPLIGVAGGEHPYKFFDFREDADSAKVVFDGDKVTTKNEPYGFVNKTRRMTGVNVNGSISGWTGSGASFTIDVDGGDPRDWMEVTQALTPYYLTLKDPDTGYFRGDTATGKVVLKVISVAETSIVCKLLSGSGVTPENNDEVWLLPCQNLGPEYESSLYGGPVLVLPIKNALAELTSLGESVSYVEYPTYQDGTARSIGKSEITTYPNINGEGKRADEYITYLLSQLLTSTLEISQRAVNAAGDKTMDKIFTTAIKDSGDGFKTRLEITQVHATSLGTVNSKIRHNFTIGTLPTVQGFTGGKSGKKVKSAGDKVQDILGILGNSNNFDTAKTNSSLGNFIIDIANNATDIFYGERDNSDYIFAIQIPYDTNTTKGNSSLDAQVAQRNHWVMTDDAPTFEKMSVSNDTHASKSYALEHDDSRRNGIHGIITDFHVHRDAEMKAYEFALKFVAANVII